VHTEKEGRGRLSSIDLLPPEADAEIAWAVQELLGRDRSQADILFELNDKLEVIGCERISRSAFNRYSMRKAMATRQLNEVREIGAAVAEALGPEKGDDVTIMLVQLIKQVAMDIIQRGNVNSKSLQEISRALASAQAAQKASAADRREHKQEKREEDELLQMENAAQVAADGISKAAPSLDPARVLEMIRSAYGIGEA